MRFEERPTCACSCHDPIVPEGVDARDVIEAAVAQGCRCLDDHCPALLERDIPEPFLGDCSTAYVDLEDDAMGRK